MPGYYTHEGPIDPILSLDEVVEYTGIPPDELVQLVRDGMFPRPAVQAEDMHYWSSTHIAAWDVLKLWLDAGEYEPPTPLEEIERNRDIARKVLNAYLAIRDKAGVRDEAEAIQKTAKAMAGRMKK